MYCFFLEGDIMTLEDLVLWLHNFENDLLVSEPALTIINNYRLSSEIRKSRVQDILKEYDELLKEKITGFKSSILVAYVLRSLNVTIDIDLEFYEKQLFTIPTNYMQIYQRILSDDIDVVTFDDLNKNVTYIGSIDLHLNTIYRIDFNQDGRRNLYFYTLDISGLEDSQFVDVVFFDYYETDAKKDFEKIKLLPVSFRYKNGSADFGYIMRIYDIKYDFFDKYNVLKIKKTNLSKRQQKKIMTGKASIPIRDPWNVRENLLNSVIRQKISKYYELNRPI